MHYLGVVEIKMQVVQENKYETIEDIFPRQEIKEKKEVV
jgi:hypothetical protein